MRPLFIALILITASISGCIEEFDNHGIIIDCEKYQNNGGNYSASNYESRECELIEYETQDVNGSKQQNKTGTEERKEEDSDSYSENDEKSART